ncbi:MAG: ABC-type transport system involved in resistance to organic solvents, permease component [uncultured Campylobacterales bacterium]|uniref:ABC-type transport system involved in resistance to organic solvents, permease component n=1 Tax=uncultured Campylobacterales bacterium TaxID=352960 RepID=A0A6S6T2K1_9BACT|nr:MAG: ABC-type transport system involved in resistance to organic solvents, permease component [uncultured Campylobacterales bacterium]
MLKFLDSFFYLFGFLFVRIYRSSGGFGKFFIFHFKLFKKYFIRPLRIRDILFHIENIGIKSIPLVSLVAIFTGLVVSIQLYNGFEDFGAEGFMGYTIFIAVTKELAPVFGVLMVISRAISSMAAEIGTMRVTEQIDAIDTLGVDSKKLLIIPRIIATTISLPLLVIIFDFLANISAYFICTGTLGINPSIYLNTISTYLELSDILSGVIKAFFFGFVISAIGTYVGYHTRGGARGVGLSTTSAVVYSAVSIFVLNYFLSSVFLFIGW